jgi:polar amino acid transport system substrate-binding protein
MKALKVLLMLLLLFFLINTKNITAAELIVVSENYPPFIINESNEISGIVTEVVLKILAISGVDYTLAVYPWARSYRMAAGQKNTLIFSITKTQERTPYFHWFCPIYKSSPIYAYKLASNPININSLQHLKKARIGILRHDHSHEYLINKGFKDGVNLDVSATEDTNIKKLVKGRIDVVIQSKEAMLYRLNKLSFGYIPLTKGLAIYNNEPLTHCMALNLDSSPEMIDKIQRAFTLWKNQ